MLLVLPLTSEWRSNLGDDDCVESAKFGMVTWQNVVGGDARVVVVSTAIY